MHYRLCRSSVLRTGGVKRAAEAEGGPAKRRVGACRHPAEELPHSFGCRIPPAPPAFAGSVLLHIITTMAASRLHSRRLAWSGRRAWPASAGASGQGPASPGTATSTTDANGADRLSTQKRQPRPKDLGSLHDHRSGRWLGVACHVSCGASHHDRRHLRFAGGDARSGLPCRAPIGSRPPAIREAAAWLCARRDSYRPRPRRWAGGRR